MIMNQNTTLWSKLYIWDNYEQRAKKLKPLQ